MANFVYKSNLSDLFKKKNENVQASRKNLNSDPVLVHDSPVFAKRPSRLKLVIGMVVLVTLMIGSAAALFLSSINQDVRQQASGCTYWNGEPASDGATQDNNGVSQVCVGGYWQNVGGDNHPVAGSGDGTGSVAGGPGSGSNVAAGETHCTTWTGQNVGEGAIDNRGGIRQECIGGYWSNPRDGITDPSVIQPTTSSVAAGETHCTTWTGQNVGEGAVDNRGGLYQECIGGYWSDPVSTTAITEIAALQAVKEVTQTQAGKDTTKSDAVSRALGHILEDKITLADAKVVYKNNCSGTISDEDLGELCEILGAVVANYSSVTANIQVSSAAHTTQQVVTTEEESEDCLAKAAKDPTILCVFTKRVCEPGYVLNGFGNCEREGTPPRRFTIPSPSPSPTTSSKTALANKTGESAETTSPRSDSELSFLGRILNIFNQGFVRVIVQSGRSVACQTGILKVGCTSTGVATTTSPTATARPTPSSTIAPSATSGTITQAPVNRDFNDLNSMNGRFYSIVTQSVENGVIKTNKKIVYVNDGILTIPNALNEQVILPIAQKWNIPPEVLVGVLAAESGTSWKPAYGGLGSIYSKTFTDWNTATFAYRNKDGRSLGPAQITVNSYNEFFTPLYNTPQVGSLNQFDPRASQVGPSVNTMAYKIATDARVMDAVIQNQKCNYCKYASDRDAELEAANKYYAMTPDQVMAVPLQNGNQAYVQAMTRYNGSPCNVGNQRFAGESYCGIVNRFLQEGYTTDATAQHGKTVVDPATGQATVYVSPVTCATNYNECQKVVNSSGR